MLTFILFAFFVSLSIAWQIWSKIGNLYYGFPSCIITSLPESSSSSPSKDQSSSPSASSMKTQSSSTGISKNVKRSLRKNYSKQNIKKNKKKCCWFNGNHNKKELNQRLSKTINGRRCYRCKYCNKISFEPQKHHRPIRQRENVDTKSKLVIVNA